MSSEGFMAKDFIPITDAAKHGRDVLTYAGGTLAVAYWTGAMWAYGGAAREGAPVQLDHEPSRYRELPSRGDPR